MSLERLPGHARVWLFASNRLLTEEEEEVLTAQLAAFVADWTAHGASLSAGYALLHHSLVVVAVDEQAAQPTGCSIDKVFRLLQTFGDEHQVGFFDRLNLIKPTCNSAVIYSSRAAKEAFDQGLIGWNDLVLNPEIQSLNAFRQSYLQPLSENWLGKKWKSSL